MTRATYELPYLHGRSFLCLPHILHNFVFSLMYLALGHEQPMSFLIYLGALVCVFHIYCTTLFFPSYISPQVSKFNFFDYLPYLPPLALIGMVEFQKRISREQLLRFRFIRALLCVPSSNIAQLRFFLNVSRPRFQI